MGWQIAAEVVVAAETGVVKDRTWNAEVGEQTSMQDEEAEAYASTAIPEGGGRNLPWAGIGAESRTSAVGLPKTKAMGAS